MKDKYTKYSLKEYNKYRYKNKSVTKITNSEIIIKLKIKQNSINAKNKYKNK